jgi:uncharacterized membrane protein YraQ (UPF0718 family)
MFEYYIAGAGLRLSQVIIYSSLWIVSGCLIAAVFRCMMGAEKTRRIFANGSRWGVAAGWLIGMLLPVCSLGVIPIVRELHRAGVKRGTIVAFGLTAPLFNPMSVLYGLTLSDPIAILSFSLCALVIVSILGSFWDRFSAVSEDDIPVDEQLPVPGIKRTIAVIYYASRELVGPTMIYILIGILGSVMMADLLPKGCLQSQVERENIFAPIVMAVMATPIYSTPLLAMSQIGGMFQHGNSIGAAFSLLILGAGANIGLICWFGRTYGIRKVLVFCLLLLTITVGLAYAIDKPLYPKGIEPAGHSHAFDVYTHPFFMQSQDHFEVAVRKAKDFYVANEAGASFIFLAMILLGSIMSIIGRKLSVESWFIQSAQSESRFDIVVPGWILGIVSVTGLVVASVVGCYLYYPSPDDLLADFFSVHAETVLTAKNQEWEAAEKWIAYSDDLSRRLEVGVFLRRGHLDEFMSTKARLYREKLDSLRESVEAKNTETVGPNAMAVQEAYRRMSEAFRE